MIHMINLYLILIKVFLGKIKKGFSHPGAIHPFREIGVESRRFLFPGDGEVEYFVEDVGRHRIIRADFFGTEINAIAHEGMPVSPDMNRVVFEPTKVNVYADDWRVAPIAQGRAA